jgi:hypothetical protein
MYVNRDALIRARRKAELMKHKKKLDDILDKISRSGYDSLNSAREKLLVSIFKKQLNCFQ